MKINNIEKGKTYLVTGGSGFLGKTLIKRILDAGGSVKTIARDEGKLIELKQDHPEVEILTGDIADPFDMKQALKGVDAVFHLAAFKHVGIAEDQPRECVKSNLIGSLNLLELTANMTLDFIMMISTDKTAIVSGVYGATKFLMERLTHQFESNYPQNTYRTVRYGNVLYSTGSVLCKWKKILENNQEVIITNPEATRFYWTVEQAVDLIFDCLENATDSQPYVPEMKSIKMGDLLTAMAEKYLPVNGTLKVKEIGMQPGENLHEKVLSDGISSDEADKFTIEEIKTMI
jgi:UDP-N-acetylglucosamine 4,6-dehydratase